MQKQKRLLSLRPNKKTQKTSTMKKVFAILAVAAFMTACNSGENKEATTDSTATVAPAATDSSAATTDSSAAATTDSSAAAPAAH